MERKEEEEGGVGIHAQAPFNRIKSKVKTLQRYLGVEAHQPGKRQRVGQSGRARILKQGETC